jgi:phosphatidate cytidylyltransferase
LLRWRLISAAVILAALLTLVVLDYRLAVFGVPGAWLLPVLLAVSLLATGEVLHLLAAKDYRPATWPVFLGNALIPLAASAPVLFELAGRQFPADNPLGRAGWPLVALAAGAIAVLGAEMNRFRSPGGAVVQAALGLFTLVYVGLLFSFLALLRLYQGNEWGLLALVSVLLVTKVADTGAYAFGRTFGRHKMTPILSPGKTWEGAAGGVACACLASWLCFKFLGPWIVTKGYVEPAAGASLAYGLILAVAGMHGDLAESLLKRDSQRKDSSTWLPGLGGVLDIIDAVLVAAPCGYLCWVLGLIGPGG